MEDGLTSMEIITMNIVNLMNLLLIVSLIRVKEKSWNLEVMGMRVMMILIRRNLGDRGIIKRKGMRIKKIIKLMLRKICQS